MNLTVKEENEIKKEYLKGYQKKTHMIKSLIEQKRGIIEVMESAKAIEYSDMPKGNKQSDLSDYMVKLENLAERIENTKHEQINLKLGIEEHIMQMDDGIDRDVLRKKYIEAKSWETIADELNVSVRHVYRLHGQALISFKCSIKDVIV